MRNSEYEPDFAPLARHWRDFGAGRGVALLALYNGAGVSTATISATSAPAGQPAWRWVGASSARCSAMAATLSQHYFSSARSEPAILRRTSKPVRVPQYPAGMAARPAAWNAWSVCAPATCSAGGLPWFGPSARLCWPQSTVSGICHVQTAADGCNQQVAGLLSPTKIAAACQQGATSRPQVCALLPAFIAKTGARHATCATVATVKLYMGFEAGL